MQIFPIIDSKLIDIGNLTPTNNIIIEGNGTTWQTTNSPTFAGLAVDNIVIDGQMIDMNANDSFLLFKGYDTGGTGAQLILYGSGNAIEGAHRAFYGNENAAIGSSGDYQIYRLDDGNVDIVFEIDSVGNTTFPFPGSTVVVTGGLSANTMTLTGGDLVLQNGERISNTANDTITFIESGGNKSLSFDLDTADGPTILTTTGTQIKLDSDIVVTGDITILNSTPILVFQDSDSLGANSVGYIEWKDSGGGRAGFLGNNTSGNDDLFWKNEQGGNIGIETTGAGEFQVFANTVIDGQLAVGTTLSAGLILDVLGEAGAAGFAGDSIQMEAGTGGGGLEGPPFVHAAGLGGTVVFTSGDGGACSTGPAGNTGGTGGTLSFAPGDGGAATVANAVNAGGGAGMLSASPGTGGAATGTGTATNDAGNGTTIAFTAGLGGNAANGTTNNGGDGGDINFKPGAKGTGSTADGADGVITLGDGTNEVQVSLTGDMSFKGTATVWKDINLGAALLARPAASQPSEANFLDEGGGDTGITTLAYAVGEKASGSFEMQHDYKEGSSFTFHVHWQGIAAPSGTDNVQWRLTYTLMRDLTTLDAATIIDSPDTPIDTQYESYKSDFAAIDGSTAGNNGTPVQIEDQLLFTIERVAATGDAYAGTALVATVGMHYELDTVGSRTISAK